MQLKPRAPWDSEEDAILHKLASENKNIKEISFMMKRCETQIRNKIKQLKIPHSKERKYWTENEIQVLKEMRGAGFKDKEIAAKLNRKTTDIFAKAKSLKILCSHKKIWTSSDEDQIRKLVSQGYGVLDLARYFKRDRKTIRVKLKSLEIETIVQNREIEQKDLLAQDKRKCFLCGGIYPNTAEFFYQKRKCKKYK